MTFKQRQNEPFMAYVRHLNDEVIQVDDYTNQAALQIAMNGLRLGSFKGKCPKECLKPSKVLWKRLINTRLLKLYILLEIPTLEKMLR